VQTWIGGTDGATALARMDTDHTTRFGRDLGKILAVLQRIKGPLFTEDCAGHPQLPVLTDRMHDQAAVAGHRCGSVELGGAAGEGGGAAAAAVVWTAARVEQRERTRERPSVAVGTAEQTAAVLHAICGSRYGGCGAARRLGCGAVPYMLYLARGRDQHRPACPVLPDSDRAGQTARKQILWGGARGKPTVSEDLHCHDRRVGSAR
jgi:hypothetical protein